MTKTSDVLGVFSNGPLMKRFRVSTVYSDGFSTCKNTLEYEALSVSSAKDQALKKQRGRIVEVFEIV